MLNCFSRWVCKQFVLLPAFSKAYRLLTSSRALGIVKLEANLQQGSKVYSMISCQEAEPVEFWAHPLRTSLRSCSLWVSMSWDPASVVWCPVLGNNVWENIYLRYVFLKLKDGHNSILISYQKWQGYPCRRGETSSDSVKCPWANQWWMWINLTLQSSLPVWYLEAELISLVVSKPLCSQTIQCGIGMGM